MGHELLHQAQKSGNQFVGNCVFGCLPFSKDFAASQVYFDFSLLT
jgi:hypothetical protein